jgi:hypothetical protein
LKIRFQLQVESYISYWRLSKSGHLARYVSRHNAMAYDTIIATATITAVANTNTTAPANAPTDAGASTAASTAAANSTATTTRPPPPPPLHPLPMKIRIIFQKWNKIIFIYGKYSDME